MIVTRLSVDEAREKSTNCRRRTTVNTSSIVCRIVDKQSEAGLCLFFII